MRRDAISLAAAALAVASVIVPAPTGAPQVAAFTGIVDAGGVLRVAVPEARGGKTVVGQLTVDRVREPGFVTAYPCDDGPPRDTQGRLERSDLNYDGRVRSVASNRLVVEADDDGDICLTTSRPAAIIVDVNGTSFDAGIESFANRRTDTRTSSRPIVDAGGVLRVAVPEARGGRTVVGQLTVDRVREPGFITAYPCDDGPPRDPQGRLERSDLNYDGRVESVVSNRLVVEADDDGDICFTTSRPAAIIVDVNGVGGTGISTLPPRRVDTRDSASPVRAAGSVLRISVPEATAGTTVIGQLTVDRAREPGFVTAYPCAEGLPTTSSGVVSRSDLNFDGRVSPVASNRLVVEADLRGEVCVYSSRSVALIVDITGMSRTGIQAFPNRRTDSRLPPESAGGPPPVHPSTPTWPAFTPSGPWYGVSALTGLPVSDTVAQRPVVAVKIDNFPRARPQWGLEHADVVFELNVEGLTRFMALYQSTLPAVVGPVRSARTGDLALLEAMNRPVFAYSGANAGVGDWIRSAASSGVIVDFSGQRRPCFARTDTRPGPHNLQLDASCTVGTSTTAGPARPLWDIDTTADTSPRGDSTTMFTVSMDGVTVDWTWDAATSRYLRSQNGEPHVADSGTSVGASNVVVVEAVHEASAVDARSPHPVLVGSGRAIIHRQGHSLAATWERRSATSKFMFRDAATGLPVRLDPGTTFVHIARPS